MIPLEFDDLTTQTPDNLIVGALVFVLINILALLGLALKTYGHIKTAAAESTQANQAVNNIGPGEHRLYDQVIAIKKKVDSHDEMWMEFTRRWGNLPEDMDSGVDLAVMLRSLTGRVDGAVIGIARVEAKVDVLTNRYDTHVERMVATGLMYTTEDKPR